MKASLFFDLSTFIVKRLQLGSLFPLTLIGPIMLLGLPVLLRKYGDYGSFGSNLISIASSLSLFSSFLLSIFLFSFSMFVSVDRQADYWFFKPCFDTMRKVSETWERMLFSMLLPHCMILLLTLSCQNYKYYMGKRKGIQYSCLKHKIQNNRKYNYIISQQYHTANESTMCLNNALQSTIRGRIHFNCIPWY